MTKTLKLAALFLGGAAVLMSGCSDNGSKPTPAPQANNDDYYEVRHEGRIHVFDDAATYLSFLDIGETSYRKVRIGEGPNGETIVFGLTKEDKKKREGIASVDMYDGKLAGADDFYGELQMEGRIYVFDSWKALQTVKQTGEAAYRFTRIGAGPRGETVVFVLTKENKKKRPDAPMARFNALRKK